ncbi:DegT/DnrJ/EryC1/StrS family aminotransferase [Streptomyces sp. NPDC026206]|uniref:DegT/DnrJ/EryC1/StrS family aminotransferase n=1 Tax=Streptomyces sp. NPDC026206 TaxID=3157089 RepID=UPI0033E119C3
MNNDPQWKVTVADAAVGAEEAAAVTAVLESRWLSVGAVTRAFEEEFAERLGAADAVAVSSGTAALHLAALALGIGAGDEVITPSLNFVASAEVCALHGARPVFADVRSEQDPVIDPEEVRRLLTGRTRAVFAMHYAGYPADLAALRALCDEHGVALIEDAAHAPLVSVGGAMAGTVGDIGCFSFFATKNLTTGEGGMVVARDPGLLGRIRSMRSHFLTSTTMERMRTGGISYDVPAIGLNYRPTEISSAIGRVQLRRLTADRERRRALSTLYRQRLRGVGIPFAGRTGDSAHHLATVILPPGADREEVRAALRAAGVQTSVHYPPTHQFSYYRDHHHSTARPLPVTESIAPRLLTLPLHARMSDADAGLVADTLGGVLHRPAKA